MAGVGFRITGIEDIEDIQKDIDAGFSKGVWLRIMREAAERAYQRAYELCPVDTGKMQGALRVSEVKDSSGYFTFSLECDVPHASINEYGWLREAFGGTDLRPKHYKGGYRPFMRPGVIKAEKYVEREIRKHLEKRAKWSR